MNIPFLSALFNRESSSRSPGISLAAASTANVEGKKPADQLANLTERKVESDLRTAKNEGRYADPTYTFHELASVVSALGDKVDFWRAKVGAIPWTIRVDTSEGVDEQRAEAQRQALYDHYDSIRNLHRAIRHLAEARFYGFAALKVEQDSLIPVMPWNVVRDLKWSGDTAPSYNWYFNRKAASSPKIAELEEMKTGEYIVREADTNTMLALMVLALQIKAITHFRNCNLEEASKNQVIILTGAGLPDPATQPDEYAATIAALTDARDGKSVVLAKGDPDCPTEVVKPTAANGLPYYNETLEKIDQQMTKAVTGGLLTMLSMDTGIGNGASDNHAETLANLINDDVLGICEAFWENIDEPVLRDAGLLQPGERPLAWFDLGIQDRKDAGVAASTLATLRTAGYAVTDEQASEMLGFDVETRKDNVFDTAVKAKGAGYTISQDALEKASGMALEKESAMGGDAAMSLDTLSSLIYPLRAAGYKIEKSQLEGATKLKLVETLPEGEAGGANVSVMNRAEDAMEEKSAEDLDKGFLDFLDELAAKTGQGAPDEKWRRKIRKAIETADPADLADSETFRKYLEAKILKAEREDAAEQD